MPDRTRLPFTARLAGSAARHPVRSLVAWLLLTGAAIVVVGALLSSGLTSSGDFEPFDREHQRENLRHWWKVKIKETATFSGGGSYESTPVLWNGRVYIGARNGYYYCLGDR